VNWSQESSAVVSRSAQIGDGSHVWHFAQIREGAHVGQNCIVGKSAYIGPGVVIGNNCKIQNNALIYEPASLADSVFVGPGVILTNDKNPRSTTIEGDLKASSDWEPVGVMIMEGASIGAGAICIAPLQIGRWSLVAAGSVVNHNVLPYALVAGNPARQIGWVGRSGYRLLAEGSFLVCPKTGIKYREYNGELVEERS
jgi:UDP-2-acetamido-3-amino-2,3-dideoxy-glucuronate N-acetyltransferase